MHIRTGPGKAYGSNSPQPTPVSSDHPNSEGAVSCPLDYVRDVSFGEDASTSRTGRGPVNLATIRATIMNALRGNGYHHIPEGRRDHTQPVDAARLHGFTNT